MGDTDNIETIFKFKRDNPEQFHCLVKMHLSFMLDMNTDECDCSFLYDHLHPSDHGTPKRKGSLLHNKGAALACNKKGIMEGVTLTMEGVCQIFQIIQFLDRGTNIEQIGLFRKTGNLQKQKVLKERLNRGVPMDFDKGEFSVHECASVLKNFLSELPEPLLTDRFFHAHCQVANKIIKYYNPKVNHPNTSSSTEESETSPPPNISDMEFRETSEYQRSVEILQLLFLLIPDANYNLLKDMLSFLNRITLHQSKNKMSASNLGTIFATHLMCPRKLSAESLQSNHQLYSSAATFMIEQADVLFNVPGKVVQDVMAYSDKRLNKDPEMLRPSQTEGIVHVQSPVVNTIFSFVDRQRTKEVTSESTTDTALAELYAQVQGMPESAQKKRLISKLNDANGYGTPKIRKPSSSKAHHPNVTETFENFKNWITPRQRKTVSNINSGGSLSKGGKKEKPIGRSGSYSLKQKKHSEMITLEEQAAPHSFKRCISEPQEGPSCNSSKLQFKGIAQAEKLCIKEAESVVQNISENIEPGTFVASNKIEDITSDDSNFPPPLNVPATSVQKRAPPPIPLRVSSLKPKIDTPQSPNCNSSTNDGKSKKIIITPCVQRISSTPLHSASDEEEEIMMETKSINTHSVAVRQKLNFLDDSYENDDSKDEGIQQMFDIASETHKQSSDKNTESSLVNNFCDKSSNTENSIGTNLNEESEEKLTNDSVISSISTTSSYLWREGERILNGDIDLSDSMQLCLDGKNPIISEKDRSATDHYSSPKDAEGIANVIGLKGMKGIENYLKQDKRAGETKIHEKTKVLENEMEEFSDAANDMHTSISYADTVSALLKSPQQQFPPLMNKENDNTICKDINGAENEHGLKSARKRSLTEMIGHNPLSKERKPLGQKSCFETDL